MKAQSKFPIFLILVWVVVNAACKSGDHPAPARSPRTSSHGGLPPNLRFSIACQDFGRSNCSASLLMAVNEEQVAIGTEGGQLVKVFATNGDHQADILLPKSRLRSLDAIEGGFLGTDLAEKFLWRIDGHNFGLQEIAFAGRAVGGR